MLSCSTLLFLSLPVALGAISGYSTDAMAPLPHHIKERRTCKHHQAIGCITDLMERTCEGEIDFMPKLAEESVYLCSCPEPFEACKKGVREDSLAHTLIAKYIEPLGESTTDKDVLLKALQDVRSGLWKDSDECRDNFANPKPYSTCVADRKTHKFTDDGTLAVKGGTRAPKVALKTRATLERLDMYCELITWQHEELGDLEKKEFEINGCPTKGLKQCPKEQTLRRHSQKLSKDEL
jgi:hypothetical protein